MAPTPLELFYCYSHRDEELRNELENHLAMLKRQGVISGWHDRRIGAGKDWEGEIDTHLRQARVILLLISSDFLSSDYCYDIEMKTAMEMHETKVARVIPVILRPVDWSGAPFGKLLALPTDAKPVTSWPNRDEAFVSVARGIRAAVEELGGGVVATGPAGGARLAEHMLAANEATILHMLAKDHKCNPSGIGIHEQDLAKNTDLSLDVVTLTVKGLEVKGLVQTGNGTDNDRFGFAMLTQFGIRSIETDVHYPMVPTSESDDEELGILDLQVAAEEAIHEITALMNTAGKLTEDAAPKLTKHGENLQALKASGSPTSAIRNAVTAMARDLIEYAQRLEEVLPPMHDAWERMVENTSGTIGMSQFQSAADRVAAREFIGVMTDTRSKLQTLVDSIRSSREIISALRGVSQDLNRAIRRVERVLDSLATEIVNGNDYLATIERLVGEKLGA